MKRVFAMATALVLSLGILAGCGGSTTPATPAAPAAPAAKTVKIGLSAPLTGDVKTFGESTKNAFQLALDQNKGMAGNWKVETVIGDDKNDPTEGVNIATKFITQDKVSAIVGSVSSKISIPISEFANAQKVVQITSTSTNTKVTVDDKGNRKPYIFRACFIDPFQGLVGAKFALGTLKAKTAAIMYDKGNDYTVGLANQFRKNFEAGGGQVVAFETYAQTDSDFSAVLTNIAAKKPDMLYLPDYYQTVSLIAKQARAKGITAPFVGGDGWDSPDLDYATLDGGYFTNHYSADDTRPEVVKFVTDYKAKYGATPDALAALAYDATNLLLQAIAKADSNDPTKIRDAMQSLKVQAVSGAISFDANGDPVKGAAILQVQKNKTYKFITTVNP